MRSVAVLAALLVGAAYLIGGMKLAARRRLVRIMAASCDSKGRRATEARHGRVQPQATTQGVDVPVALGFVAAVALLVDLHTAVVSALPAVFGWALWRRRRHTGAERRQSAAAAAVGPCADLLAACLSAGASVEQALSSVTPVAPPLLRERLDQVGLALRSGATAAEAWEPVRDLAALDALARAVVRAEATGAPLAAIISALADELRRERRWAAEAAARKAGVYAVAPLAVCFLPAFVLLGVVPLVVGIAADALRLS